MALRHTSYERRLTLNCLRALLLLSTLSASAIRSSCLDNAVPSAERKLLNDPNEGDIPLRLWTLDWTSASIVESIYTTLAEEVLGYVVEESGHGLASSSGIFALTACPRPNEFHVDRSCQGRGMQHHVVLEVWQTAALEHIEHLKLEAPARMPQNVGSIGYIGMETLFVLGNAAATAYGHKGLPLDYYRSYDLTWHNVSRYFDSYASVGSNALKPCNATLMMNPEDMDNYVRVSGDIDGVVLDGGAWRARCWSGRWWLSPKCRTSPEQCVPLITGGNGWFFYAIMSVSTRFQIPVAIATAATWGNYLSIPRQSEVLLYWWTPDLSFVDLHPKEIMFPRFDPQKWSEGDKSSVAREVSLTKWTYRNLGKLAPQLFVLTQNLMLSGEQIDDMLLQVRTTGGTPAQVACTWLREHTTTWERWLPRPTACVAGQGLVNASSGFARARVEATNCAWCTAGHFSSPLVDELGLTHACVACAPGRSEDGQGSTECTKCTAGYHASEPGMLHCVRCSQGRYEPSEGSSLCEACAHPLTTDGLGSLDASECVCPKGTYKHLGAGCRPCPPGFSCPIGSNDANMPCNSSGAPADEGPGAWPSPLPLHVAFCSDPTRAYRCLVVESCMGGGMGRCGPHMSGIACGMCSKGYFHRQGQCHECWLRSLQVWFAILGSAGPFVFVTIHAFSAKRADMRYGFADTVLCMAYILLVEAQVVSVMASCDVAVEGSFSSVVVFVSGVLDVISGMSNPTCFAGLDFTGSFVFNALRPVAGLLIYVLTYGTAEILGKLHPRFRMNWNIGLSIYGGIYFIFFIGIAGQAVSLWHCYEHPDGTSHSMYDAPHILCGSVQWRGLVAMAIAACLIFCAGFLALVCYAVYVAPVQAADVIFRTRWRFLFIRFRPSSWWWGVLLMMRGLWLCLSTTIFASGLSQLLWVQVMLVAYGLSCCGVLPWQSMAVTTVDICSHMALILICSLLLAETTKGVSNFSAFVLLFVGPMVLAGLLIIGLATHRLSRDTRPEAWNSGAEQLRHVLQDVSKMENLGFILSRLPLADLQVVRNANRLLQAEILGHQPRLHRTFSPTVISMEPNFDGHWRPVFRTESFDIESPKSADVLFSSECSRATNSALGWNWDSNAQSPTVESIQSRLELMDVTGHGSANMDLNQVIGGVGFTPGSLQSEVLDKDAGRSFANVMPAAAALDMPGALRESRPSHPSEVPALEAIEGGRGTFELN